MKNFAICYNKKVEHSVDIKNKLLDILKSKKVNAKSLDIDNLKNGFDFAFVIGGDGTILKAARFFAKAGIPIFGINRGRLGFLSQSSACDLEAAIDKILDGKYIVQNRIMLKSGNYAALNDFVVKSSDTGRTSKFSLKINGKFICDYLADGIIISTPTGSTAYGLSAGGPVVNPALDVFIIIPICPHTLTARPIVVPDSEKITISTEKGVKSLVSADGQEFYESQKGIVVEKSEFYAKLALLDDADFYSVLKNKLHWSTTPEYDG